MPKNYVKIDPSQCKGCKVCIESCPKHCLFLSSDINDLGYQYAKFEDKGCIGCAICFYACPEVGAITVYKDEKEEEKK